MLRLDCVDSAAWITELEDAWQELFRLSDSATPFQSFAWVSVWWKTFGRSRKPHILTLWDDDKLVGLYPLFRSGLTLQILQVMGTGHSDYLVPLIRAGYEESVCDLIRSHLNEVGGVDLVNLQQIRETHPMIAGLTTTSQAICPFLNLPDSFDSYCKNLSKSLRYDIKKGFGRNLKITSPTTPDEAEQALEIFLSLHKQRWKARGLPGAFAFAKTRSFHKKFVRVAVQSGVLRFYILHDEQDVPIGALYAMHAGKTTYFYQSGFDPAAQAMSPGTILVATAVKSAIEEGDSAFDFLRGDEPYKLRWKPDQVYKNEQLLIPRTNMIGKIAHSRAKMIARLEHLARERFEGGRR